MEQTTQTVLTTEHRNFLQNVLHGLGTVLGIVKKDAQAVLTVAVNLLNDLKVFLASPEGMTLEKLAAKFVPAEYIAEFVSWVPTIFTDLGIVKAAIFQTPDQIVLEGLNYINSASDNAKTTLYTGIAGNIGAKLAALQGTDLPVSDAIAQTPAVYAQVEAGVNTYVPISAATAITTEESAQGNTENAPLPETDKNFSFEPFPKNTALSPLSATTLADGPAPEVTYTPGAHGPVATNATGDVVGAAAE